MAYTLIKAGFKQITVFESSDYIGGMSRSIYHRRTPHDMGAYNIHSGYDELYKLINEFDAGVPIPGPEPNLWVDRKSGSRRKFIMSKYQYCSAVAEQLKPGINDSEVFTTIFAALTKYKTLHQQLFGIYKGSLMPRPSKKVLASLNMTTLEFLELHDIEILKCVLGVGMTAQGYGHLDEVSAIYGLIWMHPTYMAQLVLNPESSFNQILSKGYQFIWQEIVRQLNIDVRLSSPVTRIVREVKPRRRFDVTYSHCFGGKTETFDFLILSPTMNSLIKTVNFNKKENRLFEKTTHGYLATSLVDTTYGKRRSSSPHKYHIDNILSKVDNKVVMQRDTYSSMAQHKGRNYTAGLYPGGLDGIKEHSTVYYQLGSKPCH
ncbi:uncharacterized protein LOC117333150 [Pecten maximus]|uniref:uncharacterized protein LOC117333150 n=1 Tax=Pecten maximus TaxID=6579 RepID=UPI001458FCB2|nr:uncharacterized protein LOC117333150 [Pecten maximus]